MTRRWQMAAGAVPAFGDVKLQSGDILPDAKLAFKGDFTAALGAIRAKSILLPCSDDLYFPPEDNEIEVGLMPNAELLPFSSPWGHCVASPGNVPEFQGFLDKCIGKLLPK